MTHFFFHILFGWTALTHPVSMDQIRCELQFAQISGARQQKFAEHEAQVRVLVTEGAVPGYTTPFHSAFVHRDLTVLVPDSASLGSDRFRSVLANTVGILWRDTTGVGEIFGHSYIRVGDRLYDLQIANPYGSNFLEMMQKRFDHGFTMRDRVGRTPYYETLFPISEAAKAELIRYFEDRVAQRGTIHGRPVEVHWRTGARGTFTEDGILCENCGAFSSSFAQPHWWVDYPGLPQAVRDTGIVQPNEGANAALRYLFDAEAHSLALVVWDVHHGENHLNQRHRILDTTGWEYQTP